MASGDGQRVATRQRPARGSAPTPPPGGGHVVLHIRLPDRPGALGAVASRIGAVGADITDVAVSRRDGGSAVDVFHLTLPQTELDVMALLCQELLEVDGAAVEAWFTATCCDGPIPDD